ENMLSNAAAVGEYLIEELNNLAASHPEIVEVRGRGLMIGIEIKGSAPALRKRLLFDKHIFTGGAGEHTVRLLPPLSLPRSHAKRFIEAFKEVLDEQQS
ncbi:MAG: aminotransferase class III-fold pyridoxal phosphate-dependent enzyme, partial [Duncaniella sp.]|nr:aminotransferase class III-fold pyridoxal phosphate-dependent enzyme [Duncaniella sp.]